MHLCIAFDIFHLKTSIVDPLRTHDVPVRIVSGPNSGCHKHGSEIGGDSSIAFLGKCMSNVKVELSPGPKNVQWNCTGVEGVS